MKNTSKEFYETYAKNSLEYFNNLKFNNLEKSEFPDWHNDNIGIEVRRAICSSNGEFDAFCKKNLDKKFSGISKKQLKKFGFNDNPVSNNGILYEQQSPTFGKLFYLKSKENSELTLCCVMNKCREIENFAEEIVNAIEDKLKKLNNNYTLYNENDVIIVIQEQLNYIGIKNFVIRDIVTKTIDSLKVVYNKDSNKVKFDNIYLLFIDLIIEINTLNWDYKQKDISENDLNTLIPNII